MTKSDSAKVVKTKANPKVSPKAVAKPSVLAKAAKWAASSATMSGAIKGASKGASNGANNGSIPPPTPQEPLPSPYPLPTPQMQGKEGAKKTTKSQNAIAILRADHALVSELFSEYQKTRSLPKKRALVAQICHELTVHAQVEEEIFYPAVKATLKDKALVPEATVEHATLKELISQVEGHEPEGEMFAARMMVLCEYVKHHVKEEQNEMFPKVKSSKLDLKDLGSRILARKQELTPVH
ncbi:MAG: hemerythrin domain-containing protein [Limnobacter sp.]|nr:hemerythrin domain-containing protein [Limnobacter sp.]